MVGYNSSNCAVTGSFNSGIVLGVSNVGGVAGQNITAGIINDSYNSGSVTGTDYVGGIVGRNENSSAVTASYHAGVVRGNAKIGGFTGYNADANSTVSGIWLEGTNLTPSGLGIGYGTPGSGAVTTFSAIDGTLTAMYASMTAIATDANGSSTGAITGIAFLGAVTPSAFDPLQGAYLASGGSLTLTVSALSGTNLSVTTATSLATLLTPGGTSITGSSSGSDTTYQIDGLISTNWILIKSTNTDARLNRSYVIYIKYLNCNNKLN